MDFRFRSEWGRTCEQVCDREGGEKEGKGAGKYGKVRRKEGTKVGGEEKERKVSGNKEQKGTEGSRQVEKEVRKQGKGDGVVEEKGEEESGR